MDGALRADNSECTWYVEGAGLVDAVGRILGREVDDLIPVGEGTDRALISEDAGILVRLDTEEDRAAEVSRRIEQTRALAERGVPLLLPLGDEVLSEGVLSVWPLCTGIAHGAEEHLAHALRKLHAADTSGLTLPRFDVRSRIVDQLIGVAEMVPRRVHDELTRRGLQAVMALDEVFTGGGRAVLHGGADIDSVLISPDGRAVLTPLTGAYLGSKYVDLIPIYVAYTRFHRDRARWDRFCVEYGLGDEDLAALERFRGMWESVLNIELARDYPNDPAAREELEHRLTTLDADWWSHSPWREF